MSYESGMLHRLPAAGVEIIKAKELSDLENLALQILLEICMSGEGGGWWC